MNKLCFIGAGNMGSAMISGVVNANIIDANKICVSNKSAGKLIDLNQKLKVNTTTDNKKSVWKFRRCDTGCKTTHYPFGFGRNQG